MVADFRFVTGPASIWTVMGMVVARLATDLPARKGWAAAQARVAGRLRKPVQKSFSFALSAPSDSLACYGKSRNNIVTMLDGNTTSDILQSGTEVIMPPRPMGSSKAITPLCACLPPGSKVKRLTIG